MTFLLYVLAFVEILTSFFLISAILIQKTKAQGAGLAFGASMGESLFGSQAGNFLTRTTVILAVIFLANTVLLGMVGSRRTATSVVDRVAGKEAPVPQPRAQPQPPAAPAPGGAPMAAPDFGAPAPAPVAELPAPVAPAPATPLPAPAPATPAP